MPREPPEQGWVVLRDPAGRGPNVSLNRDPEKHPSPGPIHLDLYTDEREHEVKRLLSLGATRPVLMGKWLGPGMHVNAIGASTPPFRELDSEAVARSRLYVDRRESAINEAEDFRVPRKEGIIGDEPIIGELGEALLGRVPGRTRRDEITLSKSVGLAVEDLAAAHYVYSKAEAAGVGTWVEFSGERQGQAQT